MGYLEDWTMCTDPKAVMCRTCDEKIGVWAYNKFEPRPGSDRDLAIWEARWNSTDHYMRYKVRHCYRCKVKAAALIARGMSYEDLVDFSIEDIMCLWLMEAINK